MQKIQNTATLLIPALLVFACLYGGIIGGDLLNFAWLDPQRWYLSGWVSPDAAVPNLQRFVYFCIWILPVLFGLWAIYAAIMMLVLMRRGVLFDVRVSRRLRQLGIGTSASGFTDLCANIVSPTILSWNNPTGPEPFTWYFDSEPAGLIFCGGGFYLIGWVLAEARKIADENEGFV